VNATKVYAESPGRKIGCGNPKKNESKRRA